MKHSAVCLTWLTGSKIKHILITIVSRLFSFTFNFLPLLHGQDFDRPDQANRSESGDVQRQFVEYLQYAPSPSRMEFLKSVTSSAIAISENSLSSIAAIT
jgi:hypothetical protein